MDVIQIKDDEGILEGWNHRSVVLFEPQDDLHVGLAIQGDWAQFLCQEMKWGGWNLRRVVSVVILGQGPGRFLTGLTETNTNWPNCLVPSLASLTAPNGDWVSG